MMMTMMMMIYDDDDADMVPRMSLELVMFR